METTEKERAKELARIGDSAKATILNADLLRRLCRDVDTLVEALEDMVWQFGYRGVKGKRRMLGTGGLSALEGAFDALGWSDPHYPADTIGCDWPQCWNWGDACGCPHPDGYKRYCSKHSREGSANARAALGSDGPKSPAATG